MSMTEAGRHGHVSRQRLLGEGSAFVRQLARAQQADAQQGPQQAAGAHNGLEDDINRSPEPAEPAVITYNELWDARTTAHHVSASVADFTDRLLGVQLWWPHAPEPAATKAVQAAGGNKRKASRVQFLQHSGALAQIMQYQGAGVKRQKNDESARHLAASRRLTAALLGDPGGAQAGVQHAHSSTAVQESTVSSQDWVCCNKPYPGEATNSDKLIQEIGSVSVCGHVNPADTGRCQECGAARWMGPDGQLAQRLLAVMQTADLGAMGTKQVAARLAAESGSHPALGPQLQQGSVKAGVEEFLARRRAAAAGGAGDAAAAVQGPSGGVSAAAVGASLHALGVHPAADGVNQRLISWHLKQLDKQQLCIQQQQQSQGQQHRQLEQVARVHAAAAAAAALVPRLLTGVYRECNGLEEPTCLKPHVAAKMTVPPMYLWVGDVLEQAAAAYATPGNACSTSHQHSVAGQLGGSSSSNSRLTVVRPLPVRRPLPASTLQQLLDRRSAALRQHVIDYAQQLAVQGKLPVVKHKMSIASHGDGEDGPQENEVLECGNMPVYEWLWSFKYHSGSGQRPKYLYQDISYHSTLPADDRPRKRGRRATADDVDVINHITCDDWQGVKSVRAHMQHIIAAWLRTVAPGLAAVEAAEQRASLEGQLQHRLIAQLQDFPQAWGTAAPLALRQVLATWPGQYQQQQQAHPQQQRPQNTRFKGVQRDSKAQCAERDIILGGAAADTARPVQEAPTSQQAEASLTNHSRSSKRSREEEQHAAKPQARKMIRTSAAAASGLGHTRGQQAGAAADSTNGATRCISGAESADRNQGMEQGDTLKSSGPARQVSRGRRGPTTSSHSGSPARQPAAGGQQLDTAPDDAGSEELCPELYLYLESLDDLLVSKPVEDCHVRSCGAWRPVGTRAQAVIRDRRTAGSRGPGSLVADALDLVGAHGLPTGMRAVLRQGAAVGIPTALLQRAAAKLQQIYASCNR